VAKHTRYWNETIYRRYIREGRGQGEGKDYKPWLTIHDFPSLGVVSRVKGQTTGRVYHLMSRNETNLFYLLDWRDDVVDIREQYPLSDLSEAIRIAESAQIRYPYDAKSGFPYVMTSDFYVETTNGEIILAVKPASELEKPRVREKLEIERRYWSAQNKKWELVTEHEINHVKARNIEWLSQAKDLEQFGLSMEKQAACVNYMMDNLAPFADKPLGILFTKMEQCLGLDAGTGLNIYKHLAYRKKIYIDIKQPIDFTTFLREPAKLGA